ncbi:MAG TPA: cytochrome c peroxidase [Gammaproteobacteria bacterium]
MNTKRIVATLAALSVVSVCVAMSSGDDWTAEEREELVSMSLRMLEPLAADPTNRVADDSAAAAFGQQLFFDTRFSANGLVSCGTCHKPDLDFQDGKPLGEGVGKTARRTMPIAGTAHGPFFFWDGRKDSLWSQALGPLESPVEHGGTRAQYAHVVAADYRADYERIFGPLPDLADVPRVAGPAADANARRAWESLSAQQRDSVTGVFVNIGKSIAAYERTIELRSSRFDRYVDGLNATGRPPKDVLSAEEIAGLRLFIGKANCTRCHNGPLLTNNDFHNTGVPQLASSPRDSGRSKGVMDVLQDEFNCRSRWSDAAADQCAELEFLVTDASALEGAFKVPSLRNVANRAPYMHAGQLATLPEVLQHYNRALPSAVGTSELEELELTTGELRQLEAFLHSLNSEPAN